MNLWQCINSILDKAATPSLTSAFDKAVIALAFDKAATPSAFDKAATPTVTYIYF